MRLLLILLIAAVPGLATQVSCATFKGTTWTTSDTAIANGNFTLDTSVSIGAWWFPSGQTYTLTKSGTQTVTLNNAGIFFKDSSSGAKTYPDSFCIQGNGKMITSSGAGSITAIQTKLFISGIDTLVGNKAIEILYFKLDTSCAFVQQGSQYIFVGNSSTNGKAIFDTASTYTTGGSGFFVNTISDTFPFQPHPTATINGAYTIGINAVNTSDLQIRVPKVILSGTSPNHYLSLKKNAGAGTVTFNMRDSCYFGGGGLYCYSQSTGDLIFNTNNNPLAASITTASVLSLQNRTVNKTATFNMGSSRCAFYYFDPSQSGSLVGNAQLNLQTSKLTIAQNWVNQSSANYAIDPGTSTVTFSGTTAHTITSAGKPFYDISINNTATNGTTFSGYTTAHTITEEATNTQAITLAGATLTGDLTKNGTGKMTLTDTVLMTGSVATMSIANGKFDQNKKSIWTKDFSNSSADTIWRSGALWLSGNFTRTAAATKTLLDSAMTRFYKAVGGSDTHTVRGGGNKLGLHRLMHRGGTYLVGDTFSVTRLITDTGRVIGTGKLLTVDSLKIKDTGSVFGGLNVPVWDSLFYGIQMGYGTIKKHIVATKQVVKSTDTVSIDTLIQTVDSTQMVFGSGKGTKIGVWDTASANGIAGKVNRYSSSTPGSQARLYVTSAFATRYTSWTDINSAAFTITANDGTSIDGGGNLNILFPSLSGRRRGSFGAGMSNSSRWGFGF